MTNKVYSILYTSSVQYNAIGKDIFDFLGLHGDGWVLSGAVTVRLYH